MLFWTQGRKFKNKMLVIAVLVVCMHSTIAKKPTAFPCTAQLTPSIPCKSCGLKEWAKKIMTLKERPVEFSSLPSKEAYQKNILTINEFVGVLQECAGVIANECQDNNRWLHKKSLHAVAPDIFTLDRPYAEPLQKRTNFIFKPYTCRLQVRPGTICALFGDFHGSAHSLIRDLLKLQSMGYLDDNFKIKKHSFKMLFLGDYIDRGIYGVEVMYTIARLKIENPTDVLLARGNHEDFHLVEDFKRKHMKEFEKDIAQNLFDELARKFDFSKMQKLAIFRFYDLLPQAIYLGCQGTDHTAFMMCCHGGFELGYDPHALLHAPEHVHFELIETLWRKKHFNNKLTKSLQDDIKQAFDLDTLCGDIQDFVPRAPFYKITPTHEVYMGFMWNDFFVDPLEKVKQRSKKFTGWVMGRALTEQFLSWGTSDKIQLRGAFRAHQHNNGTGGPMLNLLCCSRGMVDVWKDNKIFTFVSAPDSKLEDTGELCFTYDSFVLLTTASTFDQWQMAHYSNDTGMPVRAKKWTRKVYKMQDKSKSKKVIFSANLESNNCSKELER